MTLTSCLRRLCIPLIALLLIAVAAISPAHAVDDARKVSVVSFGLFGDQDVFRSEATGAAQVVAARFGGGPVEVQYNSKQGGGATIEALGWSLLAAAQRLDAERDVLFLILTSHGSRDGLAVKAGPRTQILSPKIRPEGRCCIILAVSGLPQQEITDTHLSGSTNYHIWIR